MKWWDQKTQSSFFECWFSSQFFHSPFTFIKRLFSSSLSAISVVPPAYLRLIIFLPTILILVCASSSLGFSMMYSAYGEGNGTPLQHSCLENPMGGGAWWAAIRGVAKSRTRLSDFTFTFHFHALEKEMATHSSVLAWRIPGTGEPGGLLSMGSHRVGHDWSDLAKREKSWRI